MVANAADALSLALPLFFLGLGALVFVARPVGRVNRVAGAYLFLTGAADLMWHLMWTSSTHPEATAFAHAGAWYAAMIPFLTLLLVHELYPPVRPEPWRRMILGAVFAANAYYLVSFASDPGFLVAVIDGRPGRMGIQGTFAQHVGAIILHASQAAAFATSARVALSPSRTRVRRQQAAVIAAAFLLPLFHSALDASIVWPVRLAFGRVVLPGEIARAIFGVGLLVLCLVAAPSTWRAFEDPARRRIAWAVRGALAVVAGTMALDPMRTAGIVSVAYDITFIRRAIWATFGLLLALAFVRFGIVGLSARTRRRATRVAHASLLALALMLPVSVLLFVGGSHALLAVAIILSLVGIALAPAPLRTLRAGAARVLNVDGAVAGPGELARAYMDALDRRAGSGQAVETHDDSTLAALRAELGLSLEDHDRLARLGRDPHRRSRVPDPPLLGRYEVERELGRGAFGTALLALDVVTGERVVLKRYHGQWMEKRALDEAHALARVRHPRVVPLLAMERAGNEVFLVLAHMRGGTLEALLRKEGPLPPSRAVALARDLLDGLAALHDAGLAHGDVKPANLLLDDDGRLVVADLGAAQLEGPREADTTLTKSPIIGSYATIAPEMLHGARRSAASDVYAAGAVLYRILTGEDYVRFEGRTPVDLMHAVLHDLPRIPHARIPRPLATVIACTLDKSPKARYPDARAMRAALDAAAPVAIAHADRETATGTGPDGASSTRAVPRT